MARTLYILAEINRKQGEFAQAELLYKRSLSLYPSDKDDPIKTYVMKGLVAGYLDKGMYAEAEPLLKQVMSSEERTLSSFEQSGSDPLLSKAMPIPVAIMSSQRDELAKSTESYAAVLRKLNRANEAESFEKRAGALHKASKAASP